MRFGRPRSLPDAAKHSLWPGVSELHIHRGQKKRNSESFKYLSSGSRIIDYSLFELYIFVHCSSVQVLILLGRIKIFFLPAGPLKNDIGLQRKLRWM